MNNAAIDPLHAFKTTQTFLESSGEGWCRRQRQDVAYKFWCGDHMLLFTAHRHWCRHLPPKALLSYLSVFSTCMAPLLILRYLYSLKSFQFCVRCMLETSSTSFGGGPPAVFSHENTAGWLCCQPAGWPGTLHINSRASHLDI